MEKISASFQLEKVCYSHNKTGGNGYEKVSKENICMFDIECIGIGHRL